ncbi:MAG: ATP-dependent helicase, partial [Sulfolobaceae archaeon]
MNYTYATEYPDEEIYKILTEPVRRWFRSKYKEFTPPQRMVIPIIKERMKNVLVSSPTGSGKTLAAFLGIIDSLIELGQRGELDNEIYAVYISPLRALNNDMRRNLIEPLSEIKSIDPNIPDIKVAVRTSDTSSYEKQKMLKTPPHILITTPESFANSLVSYKFKEKLRNVRWIIIDEIHEIASSKRGAYLLGLLEIFKELLAKEKFIRVGLSATVAPLEELAKFLTGIDGECVIADARFSKPVDIKVITPVKDLIHSTEDEIEKGIYKTLLEEIKKHRTTLIFTNTRHATEKVAYKLKKINETEAIINSNEIEAHHSSLSRDIRLEVEEKLKRGELKVVVSSTSLELGIDIGYIDLVILLSSPKSVSRLLQRIGRAGHHIRSISKGRIVVVDRDDLVECTVLAKLARERKIDKIHIPKNPLDVLTQLIVAASLISTINKDKLYEVIKRAYNYWELSKEDYENVINYLAGRYELENQKVYSKIRLYDDGNIKMKMGARMIFLGNSGTIPDEAKIPVFTEDKKYVGNLEEEFVEILTPGDIFVLGGRTYEFVTSRPNMVIVRMAEGQRPTVPSWYSEMLPLAYDSAIEIAKFRGLIAKMIMEGISAEKIINYIQKEYEISKSAAQSIYTYIYEQYLFTGGIVPSDELLLIEIYDDEEDRRYFIFHTLVGRRTNDALSRAVAYVVSKDLSKDIRISVTDNGFAIILPDLIDYNIEDVFNKLEVNELYNVLSNVILRTELLKRRFRHCAERSFMILKRYKGRETSIDRRQVNSEVLLSVIKEIKDFPILKETIREILEDYMDIKHAMEVLSKIKNGEIRVVKIGPNSVPSPFAHNIILKEYADIVLAEDKRRLLKELHERVIDF